MPTLTENLHDGLRIRMSNGKLTVTRVFIASELTGSSDTDRLSQALTLTSTGTAHTGANLPLDGEVLTVRGQTLYANEFDVQPWGEADGIITVVYTTEKRGLDVAGYGPVTREVGSTVEQTETDFNIHNLKLPYASRTPIEVSWDPNSAGAPGAGARVQGVRVQRYAGKSTRCYTNQQSVDPADEADAYVSCVNSVAFDGKDAGTLMILSITGRNDGDGIWSRRVEIAHDPAGFKAIARATDPDTGLPVKATTAQVAANNGVKEEEVQDEIDFNSLHLS